MIKVSIMADEDKDRSLLDLVQQILSKPDVAVSEIASKSPAENEPGAPQMMPTVTAPAKETRSAAELARMIEYDLAKYDGCPKKGFQVTVYGATAWRAMLTITPAAGGLRNAEQWRKRTQEIAEELQARYDLSW